MPDDHSELVPPLPIPNRTVKRLSADDSAATSVKVGHRQAVTPENPRRHQAPGVFAFYGVLITGKRTTTLSAAIPSRRWDVDQNREAVRRWHPALVKHFANAADGR